MENSKQCPLCKEELHGGNFDHIVNMKMVSAKTKNDGYSQYDIKWVCQNSACGFVLNESKVSGETFMDYCDIKGVSNIIYQR